MSDQVEQVKQAVSDKLIDRLDSFGEYIGQALQVLATKLGTTVEYLWAAFVKKSFAEGVAGLCLSLVFALLIAASIKIFTKVSAWKVEDRYDNDAKSFTQLLVFIIGAGLVVPFSIFMYNGVIRVIAPEATAFVDLIEAVKVLK